MEKAQELQKTRKLLMLFFAKLLAYYGMHKYSTAKSFLEICLICREGTSICELNFCCPLSECFFVGTKEI